ncbi:unnamed protein product [Phytophthora fragariaefolia]|uniref:Unnamed protein product n=1 Tax=Phytophthora fragariaefolia TaxID=1490495 RepID=A0A9W6XMU7_9STRA|nr:unnamed protein product [Phytophthora fragariaefolia]
MPPPTVELDEHLLVVSFDGPARVKGGGGAYGAIVWRLSGWEILAAASDYAPDLTVNEAEYHGLLLSFDLLKKLDRGRLVVCGDSNLVIRRMRGEIDCKAPGLQLLRQKALDQLRSWPQHEFLHMKREWNQSADRLASTALHQEERAHPTSDEDRQALITLNRLNELLKQKVTDPVARVTAVTRSARRRRIQPETLQEVVVQQVGSERIVQAQNEEKWIADPIARLVVPETLHRDFLHHYHTSLEGGHQGIGRTYQRPPPGNLQTTYPFQIVAMDHIPSLPKSFKGNTEPLIWVDLFTGYVIAKASASRTAQTIAENYEECVFRRFGASEAIRHDREPGFMARLFPGLQPDSGKKAESHYGIPPTSQWDARTDGADTDPFGEDVCRRYKSAGLGRVRRTSHVRAQHRPRSCPRRYAVLPGPWLGPSDDVRSVIAFSQHPPARSRPAEVAIMCRTTTTVRVSRSGNGYEKPYASEPMNGMSELVHKHLFPIVDVSKLKLVRRFPDRPHVELVTDGVDRLDFDEALLPEDSWESALAEDELEVEQIVNVRSGRCTRYGRVHQEFLVYWKGYAEPTWVHEADLNCGALLQEFERRMADRNRFHVMQSHGEGEE